MSDKPLRILIIGASSDIAQEVSRIYAGQRASFFLVARNKEKLATVGNDLLVRGASGIFSKELDLSHQFDAQGLLEECLRQLGGVDLALVAHGELTDQERCESDLAALAKTWQVNFYSVAALSLVVAAYFEKQGRGVLAVISSVAGERGRRSNYLYGAAKAGLSTFLQGLRVRCYASGVHVLTIKPGFVDTQMTRHLKKNALFVSPSFVARKIVKAIERRCDVIFVPFFWRPIMFLIKMLPDFLCKRLNF